MQENLRHGYGYSHQSYSSSQRQSWQNGYQTHHSGMPIVPNCYTGSPQLTTHQMMMLHGNQAMHQDAWRAQQNAWQTDKFQQQQQHCVASQDHKYGHFNGGAGNVTSVGQVASSAGNYPNPIASSEYESFSRVQQAPPAARFEAMRYEESNWGGGANGHLFQSYHDGFN